MFSVFWLFKMAALRMEYIMMLAKISWSNICIIAPVLCSSVIAPYLIIDFLEKQDWENHRRRTCFAGQATLVKCQGRGVYSSAKIKEKNSENITDLT